MPHIRHSFGVGVGIGVDIGIAIFDPDSDPDPDIVANYAIQHYLWRFV
jgi:hypothetical protein